MKEEPGKRTLSTRYMVMAVMCVAAGLIVLYSAIRLSGMASTVSAADGTSAYSVDITANNKDVSIPVNAISKDGHHLFLPSGTKAANIRYADGTTADDYITMKDKNIGSLHFFSDDPVGKGMSYVHDSADHSAKAPGRVVLLDGDLNVEYEGCVEAIKGRGNRTWRVKEKKPYQIKLTNKANLLDPGDDSQKAKKWILLANAFDTTLMRNQIAYSMAKELGLENTPEGRQVDLYYDGEYCGVYFLCEKAEVGNGRVEIKDLDKDPEGITGGYLMEIDNAYFAKEANKFYAPPAGAVVVKSPEEPTGPQMEYIEGFVKRVMTIVANDGKDKDGDFVLFDHIDKESCVKYFLSLIWISNEDAFYTSTFIYKPENEEKLYFGPVWDCDHSMGYGTISNDPDEWILRKLGGKLMDIPRFRQALKEEYTAKMKTLINDTLMGETQGAYLRTFETIKSQMTAPAIMNHTALDVRYSTNRSVYYQKAVSNLENWISKRNEWFDEQVMDDSFVDSFKANKSDPEKTAEENTAEKSMDSSKKKNTVVSVKLTVPKLKAVSKKSRMIVSWKKVKNATGYQIRYCRKTGKNKWKYKVVKKTAVTVKKLARKKKYIVQARACCMKEGKKYYSKWSKAITRKVR